MRHTLMCYIYDGLLGVTDYISVLLRTMYLVGHWKLRIGDYPRLFSSPTTHHPPVVEPGPCAAHGSHGSVAVIV